MKKDPKYEKTYREVKKMLEEDSLMKNISSKPEFSKNHNSFSGLRDKITSKINSGLYNKDMETKHSDLIAPKVPENECHFDELPKKKHCHKVHPKHDKIDVVSFDIPLFLRLLEWAKEDAKTDMDLHFLVENILIASKEHDVLTMHEYDQLVDVPESEESDEYSDDGEGNYNTCNPEYDDCEIVDFEDFDMVPVGIFENKKKKKKKKTKRGLFPRRGYGFIWPLYPMGFRPPPPPKPPKPPKPEDSPEDVSGSEEVDAPDMSSSGGSSTITTGGANGSASISVGDIGGDVGGAIADAGGAVGGGDVGVGAVAEAEEEETEKEIITIGPEHQNKIKGMKKSDLAGLVAKNYGKLTEIADVENISPDKLKEKLDIRLVKASTDQSIFVIFKKMDGKQSWIAEFELNDNGNFVVPDEWKDNLGEHLFQNETQISERYPKINVRELVTLWP